MIPGRGVGRLAAFRSYLSRRNRIVAHVLNDRLGLGLLAGIVLLAGCLVSSSRSEAQDAFAVPAGVPPEQMKAMMEARARARGGPQPQPAGEQPKTEEKKEGDDKKKENDKNKKK